MKEKLKKQIVVILAGMLLFSLMPAMASAETGLNPINDLELQTIAKNKNKSEEVNTGDVTRRETPEVNKKIKSILPIMEASATTTTYQFGTNVTGVFDYSTGVLIISGTGAMTNFEYNTSPILGIASEVKEIVIDNGVTSIGDNAFKNLSNATLVTIPNSVTSLGNLAFYGCSRLTSVTIPNSVESIGTSTFFNCSGLTSLTISNSVRSIQDFTFNGCSGLTSVTIPNSVISIENYAFSGCAHLTSVTIPNSVTSIDEYAFNSCSGLTSVTIPNSVTNIGSNAFSGCNKILIDVDPSNLSYASVDGVLLNKSLTSLIYYPSGKPGNNYTIPNTVTTIEDLAFYRCVGLTSITIPDSVIRIGNDAFNGCKGMTSVTLPISLTSIGSNAFNGCKGLNTITIPDTVTTIGDNAFNGCSGLVSVIISNSLTSIGNSVFKDCKGLTSIIIPNAVTSIGNYAFCGCSGLTSVKIPNSVASIGNYTFLGCTKLASIENLYNGQQTIGTNAFSNIGTAISSKNVTAYSINTNFIEAATGSGYIVTLLESLKATGIKVTAPANVVYIKGETLNLTGGAVTTMYSNNTSEKTDLTTDMISGYDSNTVGVQTITVTLNGYTDTFTVTVKDKVVDEIFELNCIQGKELFVPFGVTYANNLNNTVFELKYDAEKLEVVDLVSQTKKIENTIGMVTGAGIEIISYTPGEIKFKVSKEISSGKTWSGTLNIFKFKAKITGKTSFAAKYN